MSKVVVNQLQHSTGGSAPALTWFTADGTNNQHAYSTDTSGTLAWKTANPPPKQGNNVKMNFPNSITTGKSFQTDGSGNLTLRSAAAPFTTPDGSEEGWRLCDRFEVATSGGAGTATLIMPTAYTSNLENVMAYRIIIKGIRWPLSSYSTNSLKIRATNQSGSTLSDNNQAHVGYQWRRGSHGGGTSTTSGAGNMSYSNSMEVRPMYNYDMNRYYPSTYSFANNNANNTTQNPSGAEGLNAQYDFYNGKVGPMGHFWSCYQKENPNSTQMTQFIMREMFTSTGAMYDNANIGGFQITSTSSATMMDGFIELYAVFKNGVVT
ncbi:MAG: hypothetical protein CMM02_02900 [Rhodopirellula sp.]|jgi:hypothetical protein|nr:hypothetical protein [Rhodopirellula sp.]|tara:strand:+ start:11975 stop:12937 length:963 start_codon:yes stop_codon:yes gene_type:complete